ACCDTPAGASPPDSPCLWRRTGLRGRGVRLCRLPWACDLDRPFSGSPQEAPAEESEACPPKPLAFHPFQAVGMAPDRAGTPGERDTRFDGRLVLAESTRTASQGLHRTGRGALQPEIKGRGLPLAHELRPRLGEINGLRALRLLLPELGERLGLDGR